MDSFVGLCVKEVKGAEIGSDKFTLITECGRKLELYHEQECCENVQIIDSDSDDVVGAIIHSIEFVSNAVTPKEFKKKYQNECTEWTFFKVITSRGVIWLRWLGTSNGYYGMKVYYRVTPGKG